MNKIFNRLTIFFLFLIVIAFSLKGLREPDLWWQIRTGEWILNHLAIPHFDIFSYTFNGTPWINIKWGSEVIYALITKLAGPEFIFLLQALIGILILKLLLRLTELIQNPNAEKNNHVFALLFTTILVFACTQYRMNGRPEMFSHLFSIWYLYLLITFRKNPSDKIFLLVLLQLLWANLHEAFGIGIVITGIFVFASWMEYFFIQNLSKEKRAASLKLSFCLLLSIGVIALNPNGLRLLLRPLNIMGQVYHNKYTFELLPITEVFYWSIEAYMALSILIAVTFLLTKKFFSMPADRLAQFLARYDSGYLLVLAAFLFLATTANRNIVFFVLACYPLLYEAIYSLIARIVKRYNSFEFKLPVVSFVIVILFYASIVSGKYYEAIGSRDVFGLRVLPSHNPMGAAAFAKQSGLQSKRCFSDYLTSSYLLWKLRPDFRTFVDLRDLDIFPPEFMDSFIQYANNPFSFYAIDSIYQFDYVILYTPEFSNLHAYLYNDSIYALKYVDAVAAVYEKTDDFSRQDIFSNLKKEKASILSRFVNKLFNPFYAEMEMKYDVDELASKYYLSVLRFDLARNRAMNCMQLKGEAHKGHALLGSIAFEEFIREENDNRKKELFVEAENSFLASLRSDPEYSPALSGLGKIEMSKNNYQGAINYFEKAVSQNNNDLAAHVLAAKSYGMLPASIQQPDLLEKMIDHYKRALSLRPGNPDIEMELGLAYFRAGDCGRCRKHLNNILEAKSWPPQQRLQIENSIRGCR